MTMMIMSVWILAIISIIITDDGYSNCVLYSDDNLHDDDERSLAHATYLPLHWLILIYSFPFSSLSFHLSTVSMSSLTKEQGANLSLLTLKCILIVGDTAMMMASRYPTLAPSDVDGDED